MNENELNIEVGEILTVGMAEATLATTAAFAPANTPSVYTKLEKVNKPKSN